MNPAWLFVNGFYRIFLRITPGASRLQEILADRHAAIAYGANNFIAGLKHIIRQEIIFSTQVNYEIEQSLQNKDRLHNLYALSNPPIEDWAQKISTAEEEALNRPTLPTMLTHLPANAFAWLSSLIRQRPPRPSKMTARYGICCPTPPCCRRR